MSPSQDAVASAVISIRRLVRVLRVAAQRTQIASGLSAAQIVVLQQLGGAERLSVNELASLTLTDRSSVADVVDRLNEQGFLARDVDPADRRRASVRITAAGRRRLARAPKAPVTSLIAAIRSLPPGERANLARSLTLLTAALGASDTPATFFFPDDRGTTRARRTRR